MTAAIMVCIADAIGITTVHSHDQSWRLSAGSLPIQLGNITHSFAALGFQIDVHDCCCCCCHHDSFITAVMNAAVTGSTTVCSLPIKLGNTAHSFAALGFQIDVFVLLC